eukprot:1037049-Pelagomonas_calceolata.AAC.4
MASVRQVPPISGVQWGYMWHGWKFTGCSVPWGSTAGARELAQEKKYHSDAGEFTNDKITNGVPQNL